MKTIEQAINYHFNNENEIVNTKTKKVIKQVNGYVRLQVLGKRKTFKVDELTYTTDDNVNYKTKHHAKVIETKAKVKEAKKKVKESSKKISKTIKKVKDKVVKESSSKKEYPYNIKKLEAINKAKKDFNVEDEVTFIDYKTKKKTKAILVSHTKFGDGYPGARVKFTKDKKKMSKIVSYTNLKKS